MKDSAAELVSIQKNAERGNLGKAFKDCELIISTQPNNAEALHLSGYISILRGKAEDAIPRLLQAVSEQPDNFVYHSTLAFAYQSGDNAKEAIASFRHAIKCNPDDVDSIANLATQVAERGGLDEGHRLLDRALEIEPGHSAARERKEWLAGHLGSLINRYDGLVPEGIGRGKPQVLYTLRPIFRIGHVIGEPFMLKCLYDPAAYDIIIFTPSITSTVSADVYELSMRDTYPIQLETDHPVFGLWSGNNGTHEVSGRTYVLDHMGKFMAPVLKGLQGGEYPYRMTLNDEDLEKGQALRKAMAVPADARIVTLFVREAGFLSHLPEHNIRNADVRNYIPAIKYLVDEGYYVIRIGDDKMHPLPDLGPQVVDTPFHPAYTRFVEPYFVSQSAFMVKTISGPEAFSYTFNIPSLVTNTYITNMAGSPDDLYLFKKYYSHRYGRNLTLREIAADKTLLFTNKTSDFTQRHIELLENQEYELLEATKQMVARDRGEDSGEYPANDRFREICSQIHNDCGRDIYRENLTIHDTDYFSLHLTGARIPRCLDDYYPELLY